MSDSYNNIEKAAVVLAMMGDDFSENILTKLPKNILKRVQEQVLPIISSVKLPEDMDGFVLEEIINNNSTMEIKNNFQQLEAPDSDSNQYNDTDNSTAVTTETEEEKDVDIDILSDEQVCEQIAIPLVLGLLLKENRTFQSYLLTFFPEQRRKEIRQSLASRGVQIPETVNANKTVNKIQNEIRSIFIKKMRTEWKKISGKTS
ncbi:MAG: hypothetical protein PHV30_07870 [Candidatus Margulisbacteria bacterium]|nr:hypothetical protein [Candidatus Margulisiibacteriota bacterium]